MKPLPQTLLTTSRVRHLEYLFQPPGLPLVEKVPEKPHTTSILVRGRAGTGKSTLAVALALDLAAMQEGRVLYLSTEIAPVDIAFKLRQLRMPPELLSGWDNATADHTVLAQHLGVYEDLEIDRPEARMEKALEKAWELVQSPPPGAALRALVIDAFSLVGATPDPGLRGVLLNLLQQLENLGISTILVEEAPAPTADWTSFLADVVFELSWAEDPDTNKLFRRLGCMKSRFVPSNPGPHDYGMEEEDLAVWPPLWGYSTTRAKAHPTTPILLRALSETTASAIQTTEMVASVLDQPGGSPDPVLRCSPWLNVQRVDCGGSTRIREGALVP
ncbi:MAG TPA: ATPase domain-containing protein, partial [Myxococcota bacterium]|nr:ATPase domain-containing protein [Myxococcota bacterium]